MNLIKKGRRILVENGYTFVALKKMRYIVLLCMELNH